MSLDAPAPGFLDRGDGHRLAYHRVAGAGPGVVFLGGFMSDMTGTKAMALEDYARSRGRAFLRFDYLGHGQSSGRFEEGTIGRWTDDAIAAIDALTEGPQVLIGSSMGGWIMLLAALARKERVAGLIGLAAAADFTEDLMWERYPSHVRDTLERDGRWLEPSDYSDTPYVITRQLIEEGRRHLLLRDAIDLQVPVRLIHGTADSDVPWELSLRLSRRLISEDVEVLLVKDGDHRLSSPRDLARLAAELDRLLASLEAD